MNIQSEINAASKWSLKTEILSKLMAPITNMVLARILAPEAFGMVATITMITSFADIFTDAGFQKYLVQKTFKNEDDLNCSTNVAFWTNFSLSLIIWGSIVLFRDKLAEMVGNDGLGNAIALASFSIPLTSFSSIQMARYRRDLDFKTLFYTKLVGIMIPIFVTIPLAFILKNFWALIIGTITGQLANAVVLSIQSKWRPKFYFSFAVLKEMFSFSIWTLLEQLMGWANLNIGIFIVGKYLSDYYLGLYKTSMASANQVLAIIINALSPVLLSSLAKNKSDETNFKNVFFQFEEKISLVVLPLGVGLFIFRELFTGVLLGENWKEASFFVGIWGLMRSLYTVFGIFSMEVFVSKGKPVFSVVSQVLELVVLLPTILFSVRLGYEELCLARSMVVFWCIFVELFLLNRFSPIKFNNIILICGPYAVASALMGIVAKFLLDISVDYFWQICSIIICIIFYFTELMVFERTRKTLRSILGQYRTEKI